jgi:hypothetical protein
MPLCYGAQGENPAFGEEITRQTQIYESRGADRPEGYVINRSLLSYTKTLAADFQFSLADLADRDRWLDIGAGEGRAVLDYCTGKYDGSYWRGEAKPTRKARAVAMSIEDRRTQQWHEAAVGLEDRMSYLSGRRLSQYTNEELGRFRMITDVLGGFSYTDNLARFTEKTLALLEVNGNFYTVLQDVREQNGSNKPHYPDAPFLTELVDVDGSELRVCSWLKRIGCVQVTCEYKEDFTPPIEVYRIQKVCDQVAVPPLTPVHYTAGTPPERRFKLHKATTREAAANPDAQAVRETTSPHR